MQFLLMFFPQHSRIHLTEILRFCVLRIMVIIVVVPRMILIIIIDVLIVLVVVLLVIILVIIISFIIIKNWFVAIMLPTIDRGVETFIFWNLLQSVCSLTFF